MGRLDAPLTPTGQEHASQIASLVRVERVDRVFASPLGRALVTAEQVAASLSCDLVVVEALAEIDHGELSGLTDAEITERLPDAWAQRSLDKYEWRFPGGESYRDARSRAELALREVSGSGARRPLLVTHEMLGRLLLMELLDLTPDESLRQSLPHGAVVAVRPATRTVRRLTSVVP